MEEQGRLGARIANLRELAEQGLDLERRRGAARRPPGRAAPPRSKPRHCAVDQGAGHGDGIASRLARAAAVFREQTAAANLKRAGVAAAVENLKQRLARRWRRASTRSAPPSKTAAEAAGGPPTGGASSSAPTGPRIRRPRRRRSENPGRTRRRRRRNPALERDRVNAQQAYQALHDQVVNEELVRRRSALAGEEAVLRHEHDTLGERWQTACTELGSVAPDEPHLRGRHPGRRGLAVPSNRSPEPPADCSQLAWLRRARVRLPRGPIDRLCKSRRRDDRRDRRGRTFWHSLRRPLRLHDRAGRGAGDAVRAAGAVPRVGCRVLVGEPEPMAAAAIRVGDPGPLRAPRRCSRACLLRCGSARTGRPATGLHLAGRKGSPLLPAATCHAQQRSRLESERLADRPNIELRILTAPQARPAVVEIVFPRSMTVAQAKQFVWRELDELSISPASQLPLWCAVDGRVALAFRRDTPAPAATVDLGQGVREVLEAPASNGHADGHPSPWVTSRTRVRRLGSSPREEWVHKQPRASRSRPGRPPRRAAPHARRPRPRRRRALFPGRVPALPRGSRGFGTAHRVHLRGAPPRGRRQRPRRQEECSPCRRRGPRARPRRPTSSRSAAGRASWPPAQ